MRSSNTYTLNKSDENVLATSDLCVLKRLAATETLLGVN
jgi:hypothetical protein